MHHEQIVVVPVPQRHEDIVEVIQLAPQELLSECTVAQVVDVPCPQFHEELVEVTTVRSGAARSNTGSVRTWFDSRRFGFIP